MTNRARKHKELVMIEKIVKINKREHQKYDTGKCCFFKCADYTVKIYPCWIRRVE